MSVQASKEKRERECQAELRENPQAEEKAREDYQAERES
jgi:hypothetical protein